MPSDVKTNDKNQLVLSNGDLMIDTSENINLYALKNYISKQIVDVVADGLSIDYIKQLLFLGARELNLNYANLSIDKEALRGGKIIININAESNNNAE